MAAASPPRPLTASAVDRQDELLRALVLRNSDSTAGEAAPELIGAQEALRRANERMLSVLDSMNDGFAVVGLDWRISYFNGRALAVFTPLGLTRDDLLGALLWDAIPGLLGSEVEQHFKGALERQEATSFEFFFAPLKAWFDIRVSPFADGLTIYFQDISERKRAADTLRYSDDMLQALASQGDLRSLLHTVTGAATGLCGARLGAFFFHGGGQRNAPLTLYAMAGEVREQLNRFAREHASALMEPVLHNDGEFISADILNDARYAAHLAELAGADGTPMLRSVLAAPVVSRSGEVFGSLFLGHPEPGVFGERCAHLVAGVAAQAAVAIDNSRLVEAARRAAVERAILLENERLARAEAERTSQMKDEFLATLSHELRTPLSAILGWAQVLRRGSRDPLDLQRGLQTIERNARVQAQLIEDLLDVSRISSGKVLLDIQAVSPATIIDAAIETVRPAADARAIRIERHLDPSAPLVAADSGRLQQVIWNLLSNAIKFTPREGIVRVLLQHTEEHVEITVSDTGMGIKPEFMAHVFERFRQADASTTRKHGGLGLGLSIVKHLVEQHGGTVRVDSAGDGQGASFTLQLPRAHVAPATARERALALAGALPAMSPRTRNLAHARVLVVDDETDARDLIKRILSDCHASVTAVGSAAEALASLDRDTPSPNLIVSDLGMADMDGFELLARVRARSAAAGGKLPAIALTAFAREDDRLRALEAGYHAHLPKPVEPSELIATVAHLLDENAS